jgi:hypothetical protein
VFDRITIELDKMAGQPCLRGLRVPVATVVAMVADGPAGEEGLNMQARNWGGVDVTNRHVRDPSACVGGCLSVVSYRSLWRCALPVESPNATPTPAPRVMPTPVARPGTIQARNPNTAAETMIEVTNRIQFMDLRYPDDALRNRSWRGDGRSSEPAATTEATPRGIGTPRIAALWTGSRGRLA